MVSEAYTNHRGEPIYVWISRGAPRAAAAFKALVDYLFFATLDDRPKGFLYHYTSFEAFESIVRSNELRLSDYRYLNDTSDCTHAFEFLSAGLASTSIHGALRTIVDETVAESQRQRPQYFVLCFSMRVDDVEQWHKYADHAAGMTLALQPAGFLELYAQHLRAASLGGVIYDDAVKRDSIALTLQLLDQLIRRDLSDHTFIADAYQYIVRSILLLGLLPKFKHSAYANETETRLVFDIARCERLHTGPITPKIFVRNGQEIPYITTTDLGSRGPLPLVGAATGPRSNIDLWEVRDLLDAAGHQKCMLYQSKWILPGRIV